MLAKFEDIWREDSCRSRSSPSSIPAAPSPSPLGKQPLQVTLFQLIGIPALVTNDRPQDALVCSREPLFVRYLSNGKTTSVRLARTSAQLACRGMRGPLHAGLRGLVQCVTTMWSETDTQAASR